MPNKKIERNIIKKMFSFAKELCNSDNPQFYELGHYLTDNLISKICIIIAIENGLNFTRKNKSSRSITYSFYDLYNKVLKSKSPNIPDFKRLEALHNQRNIYQHGQSSISHHFNKEYAQQYIEIAEEILNEVQFINKNENITPSNYLNPIRKDKFEAQKLVKEKDTKIQCINALQEICSHIYNSSFRPRNKFTGAIISALDLIKTHKVLLQSLGVSYLERNIIKITDFIFFKNKKEVTRILINVNCNQNLEIIIDIQNFGIDKIMKFAFDDNPIQDFKTISNILECLSSRIK